jgi:hypothetical protein
MWIKVNAKKYSSRLALLTKTSTANKNSETQHSSDIPLDLF